MLYGNETAEQFSNRSLDLALIALEKLAIRKSQEINKYSQKDFDEFLTAVTSQDDQLQINLLESFLHRGISIEEIYEKLIPETAEKLGNLWKDDKLSFVEVNLGSQRLHRITRIYEKKYLGPMYFSGDGPNILMVLPDGEIHTLGLITASGQFKKLGASPYIAVGYSIKDIIDLLKSENFSAVGISLSSSENLMRAIDLAQQIKVSLDNNILIILGGHLVKTSESVSKKMRVFDLITSDPQKALKALYLMDKKKT